MMDAPNGHTDRILNLGCGRAPLPDAVNHDLTKHSEFVDVTWDLNVTPWDCWAEESFDVIFAVDLVEHLDALIPTLQECWRILAPGGRVLLRTPFGLSEISFTDPTHKLHLMPRSMDYFVRGTELERQYGFYAPMRWIKREFRREGDNLVWVLQKDEAAKP